MRTTWPPHLVRLCGAALSSAGLVVGIMGSNGSYCPSGFLDVLKYTVSAAIKTDRRSVRWSSALILAARQSPSGSSTVVFTVVSTDARDLMAAKDTARTAVRANGHKYRCIDIYMSIR